MKNFLTGKKSKQLLPDIKDAAKEKQDASAQAKTEASRQRALTQYGRFLATQDRIESDLDSQEAAVKKEHITRLTNLGNARVKLKETEDLLAAVLSNFSVKYPQAAVSWDSNRWESLLDASPFFKVGNFVDSTTPIFLPNPAFSSSKLAGSGAVEVIETLLVRMLASTSGVKVHILDPHNNGSALQRFGVADIDKGGVFTPSAVTNSDVKVVLEELSRRVHHVSQNFLQGSAKTLEEYNENAAVKEDIHVVVALHPETFNKQNQEELGRLRRTGGPSGVRVLELFEDLPSATFINFEVQNGQARLNLEDGHNFTGVLDVPPPSEIIRKVVTAAENRAKEGSASLSLRALLPTQRVRPDEALSATVGTAGTKPIDVTFSSKGDRVHLLVGGRTGAGKSTFLHSLICSLAAKYSPRDLNFYLVDGKQGIEMRTYAPLGNNVAHLPHVKVAAVKSDIRMYISVLSELEQEIARRGRQVSKHGVTSVVELPYEVRPPRIVAVLDEFQVLLTDPIFSDEASKRLENVARQGRAYGIHLVLATQSLSGLNSRSLNAGLFEQIKSRLALSCDEEVSQKILGAGNTAAASLTRRGEAILNETGVVAKNIQFQVGYLEPENRSALIETLYQEATQEGTVVKDVSVFTGDGLPSLSTIPLAEPVSQGRASIKLWLGAPTKISGPVSAPLTRSTSGNFLVYGGGDFEKSDTMGVLCAATLSAVAAHRESKFFIVNVDEEHPQYHNVDALAKTLRSLGSQVEVLEPGLETVDVLENLSTEVTSAVKDRVRLEKETFVIIPDGDATIEKGTLAVLAATGATVGAHLMAIFEGKRGLVDAVMPKTSTSTIPDKAYNMFDVRVYAQVPTPEHGTLGLPGKYRPEEERMTLWSRNRPNQIEVFLPYQAPELNEWETIVSSFPQEVNR